ncbi:GNAT family N-acetyltransferase [Pseudomonas sp. P7548]|uniref:GNAT family N-acetyltransferase n=1 Tax=Pseudomonas sp. P7548 TaxID=2726981 RepID=UPI0015BFEF7E|nr:GNAT family N-acetyltransferase [Pseudomonas sp. P7548]NWE18871.1 GNAT family N-acetyltransferase [Pseudomonas sp. P7548]
MTPLDIALNNPVWHSLTGSHAHLGNAGTLAALYHCDVTPFAGLAEPSAEAFVQLAKMTTPGQVVALPSAQAVHPSSEWQIIHQTTVEQFTCSQLVTPALENRAQWIALGAADTDQMLALAAQTQPGPFGIRTRECGHYIGVRAPELVAMAGERFQLQGAVEISGVCTAASHRGKGLGGRMVAALAERMLARDTVPFLHVVTTNTSAIRLYEALGFSHRTTLQLTTLKRNA